MLIRAGHRDKMPLEKDSFLFDIFMCNIHVGTIRHYLKVSVKVAGSRRCTAAPGASDYA